MTISNENFAYLTYYVGRCTEIPTMYIRKFIIPAFLFSFERNDSTTFNYRNHAYPYTNTTSQTIFYYDLKPNIYCVIVSTFLITQCISQSKSLLNKYCYFCYLFLMCTLKQLLSFQMVWIYIKITIHILQSKIIIQTAFKEKVKFVFNDIAVFT